MAQTLTTEPLPYTSRWCHEPKTTRQFGDVEEMFMSDTCTYLNHTWIFIARNDSLNSFLGVGMIKLVVP